MMEVLSIVCLSSFVVVLIYNFLKGYVDEK
jgi:hypothetical protein